MVFLFFLFFVLIQASYDPQRFKSFLLQNLMKRCPAKATQPQLPISYYAPASYFDGLPTDSRVPPGGGATAPQVISACDNRVVQPAQLDAYSFQSERMITSVGHNIYDGATWAMALALLGETDTARLYQRFIILGGSTCQFADIRGDKQCNGVVVTGECSDPGQTGICGYCYGSNTTEAFQNAWTFREISDYWALDGTVDERCPDLKRPWIWNEYKPVLGENAWANLIGPLQVAYQKFGGIANIPPDDISLKIALGFLQSLPAMVEPTTGGLYYSPKNTFGNPNEDLGFNLSVENNVSLLGGLKALLQILQSRNIFPNFIPVITELISGIEGFVKASYSPSLGFFRQGGRVTNGQFEWNSVFAVDCQTWTMSQIGPKTVDSWFGSGTAVQIWKTTKQLGGYHYTVWSGAVDGMGFSYNDQAQCFSGEWSAGAINMLRIFSNELNDPSFAAEGAEMRRQIQYSLTETQQINGVDCIAVKYANKRYYIPFGWWANPLDSLASTTWSVFLDSNYNPLHLGGAYTSTY